MASDTRTIARLLNDYLRETDINVIGSLGATDYAQEPSFANDLIYEPVFHIQVSAQKGLTAAADHMLGFAACVEAEDVIYSANSLLRPMVTAAGATYYLVDPSIGLRERLRRGWNFELESIREQLNTVDRQTAPLPVWEEVAIGRYRCLKWGEAHGYGWKQRDDRDRARRYWLTDGDVVAPSPSDMRLAGGVLEVAGEGMGNTVYRFASAFLDAQAHAFTIFSQAHTQSDPQTPEAVPLGVLPSRMTTWLLVAMTAINASTTRCGQYFGWDMAEWTATVHPLLHCWKDQMWE
jgi:hypothetical protein